MKKNYKIIFLFFVPSFALAWSLTGSTFAQTVAYVVSLIGALIPILFSLAFILFFWGLSKFILNAGNEKGRQEGQNYMLWGVLALFILLTFRTITSFISTDLGIGTSTCLPYLSTGGTPPCP